MNQFYLPFLFLFILAPFLGVSQTNEVYDDFEGDSNIPSWFGDNCEADSGFANPFIQGSNTSATVLKYQDTGGQYANVQFQMNEKIDLSMNQTFSLQIYVSSNGMTGNQPNQVSLKLQDGSLQESWTTQSEIIKPITLDQWQTITFDFLNDNFINLDQSSEAPTLRSDFSKVVIQVNGENNNDLVLAYIDDILLFETVDNTPDFNELIWADEFDIDGAIDSDKWFHQTQIPESGSWFNGEIQHYTDKIDNSFVDDGVLHIVAKKETFNNQGVTKEYTSARLNSKFAFTYGKIEVRAKLPFGVGTWPAIWMLGKNITEGGAYWQTQGFGTTGWPACGEIDIMEHWGTNQNYVSSALHTPSSFGATVNNGGQSISNASSEFHVYTAVWSEEKIVFSVDGVIHYTYRPDIKNDDTWPFDLDQYMLFNVAVLPSIESNFIQSALEVDYIRIYQEGDCVASPESDCDQDGFVLSDDCDDNNPEINPDQLEVLYNGIDDDCDTTTLDDDLDQDGFVLAEDCDDFNSEINPSQEEITYNGIDDDCNPLTLDDDLDQDGFVLAEDCDDFNSEINPSQEEITYNGIDDDCNPLTLDDDLDQDGFVLAEDCDDLNAMINPDATEVPDNDVDEDCDGQILVTSTYDLANATISVFPNPIINVINIEVVGDLNFSATLFGMNGELIKSTENQNFINVDSLPQGSYLLEIKDVVSGQKIVAKIVKVN